MMQYDNLIMPDKARKAARILRQYCEQNGCMYCCFCIHNDKLPGYCALSEVPRNYPAEVLSAGEGGKHYA